MDITFVPGDSKTQKEGTFLTNVNLRIFLALSLAHSPRKLKRIIQPKRHFPVHPLLFRLVVTQKEISLSVEYSTKWGSKVLSWSMPDPVLHK